ncbi:MAG TPA: hypothetical protein DEB39_13020, partial [Planctomycetaceae bacterium]|nr:hypothetical protein [Planctomycetaceae bacterium]
SDSENTRNNDAGNNDAGENEARKDDSRFSCDRCRDDFFFFHRAVVLGDYEDALRSLVLRMKTERRGLSMLAVAGLLWERREHPIREANADRIVPVPMHFARRFWRGVNSPDILAGELGRRLGIPVLDRLVRRVKPTRPQFSLAPEERFENLQGAFSLSQHRRRTGRAGVNEDISNKRILLVDDILTTGNTCNTVSRLLLDAGAASVTVVAVAKAEGNKGGNKVGKAAGKTGSMRTAVKDSEDESGFQR